MTAYRQYLVYTESAQKGVSRNAFTTKTNAPAAIRAAEAMAADYEANRVTIESGGGQLAVFTGALWVQVSDERIRKALDKRDGYDR